MIDDIIKIGEFQRFRRSKIIKQINERDILNYPVKAFIWKERNDEGIFYKIDPKKRYPLLILHKENNKNFTKYYGIQKEFIENFIESVKNIFDITKIPPFKIEKTTICYLVLEIEKIELFLKYRLLKYNILL